MVTKTSNISSVDEFLNYNKSKTEVDYITVQKIDISPILNVDAVE